LLHRPIQHVLKHTILSADEYRYIFCNGALPGKGKAQKRVAHNAHKVFQAAEAIVEIPPFWREIFDHCIALIRSGSVSIGSHTAVGPNEIQLQLIVGIILGVDDRIIHSRKLYEVFAATCK
jgi:hypothetical protein